MNREEMTKELVGAVEIDETLLDSVSGGCDHDDGGGTPPPTWGTTPDFSCVPPGTLCP